MGCCLLSAKSREIHTCRRAHTAPLKFQVCSGDVTALAEIATELLAEGLCAGAVANPGMVVEAVEAMVGAYGGIKSFRKNVRNFAQFSVSNSSCFRVFVVSSGGVSGKKLWNSVPLQARLNEQLTCDRPPLAEQFVVGPFACQSSVVVS